MPTETEQRILDAIGALAIELRAQGERLAHVETELKSQGERLAHVESAITELRTELKQEVQRWDERFFQSSRDFRNLALTLITSATIAVVIGMILLIVRS